LKTSILNVGLALRRSTSWYLVDFLLLLRDCSSFVGDRKTFRMRLMARSSIGIICEYFRGKEGFQTMEREKSVKDAALSFFSEEGMES